MCGERRDFSGGAARGTRARPRRPPSRGPHKTPPRAAASPSPLPSEQRPARRQPHSHRAAYGAYGACGACRRLRRLWRLWRRLRRRVRCARKEFTPRSHYEFTANKTGRLKFAKTNICRGTLVVSSPPRRLRPSVAEPGAHALAGLLALARHWHRSASVGRRPHGCSTRLAACLLGRDHE